MRGERAILDMHATPTATFRSQGGMGVHRQVSRISLYNACTVTSNLIAHKYIKLPTADQRQPSDGRRAECLARWPFSINFTIHEYLVRMWSYTAPTGCVDARAPSPDSNSDTTAARRGSKSLVEQRTQFLLRAGPLEGQTMLKASALRPLWPWHRRSRARGHPPPL